VRRVIVRTTPALLCEAEARQVERNHVPATRGERFHDVSPTKRAPAESVDKDQRRIAAAARGCNHGAASFNGDHRGVRCSTSSEQLLWSRLCARREIDQEGEEGEDEQRLQEPLQYALHPPSIPDPPRPFIRARSSTVNARRYPKAMTAPRVLFLCTHNSARSQMAEALLRSRSRGRVEVESAGTEKTLVRPLALKALEEIGIDASAQTSKTLERFIDEQFDYVITVCDAANDACPTFPNAGAREHWSLPDPSKATGSEEQQLEVYREVRDDLELRIMELLRRMEPSLA
jgi:arsenate reductase